MQQDRKLNKAVRILHLCSKTHTHTHSITSEHPPALDPVSRTGTLLRLGLSPVPVGSVSCRTAQRRLCAGGTCCGVCVCVRVGGAERAVKRSSCVLLSGDRSLKGYTLALFLTLHAPETSQRQKHVILPFFPNRLKKQLNAGCGAPCWDRRGDMLFPRGTQDSHRQGTLGGLKLTCSRCYWLNVLLKAGAL